VVSSNTHRPGVGGPGPAFTFDLDEMKSQIGIMAYKNSKLANVWFTYELARRLKNSDIVVNTMCPGFNPDTGLLRNVWAPFRFVLSLVLPYILKAEYRTIEQQSDAEIFLATSPEVTSSGQYYWDKKTR